MADPADAETTGHGFTARQEAVIPASTRAAWAMLLPYLPEGSYLAGGTAIAVHLHHRVSRDLDFFTSEPLDTDHLVETLERSNLPFLLEREVRDRNIEITLESTKVEFTSAPANRLTEPTTVTAGVAVAGLGDLLAMKLAAIAKRRQMRDFEDIRAIELKGGRRIEEGLALALLRYRPRSEDALLPMVAALGGVSECPPDPLVVTDRQVLADYFEQRLPEVLVSLGRWDAAAPPADIAATIAGLLREAVEPDTDTE